MLDCTSNSKAVLGYLLGLVQFQTSSTGPLSLLGVKDSFENQINILDTLPQNAHMQIVLLIFADLILLPCTSGWRYLPQGHPIMQWLNTQPLCSETNLVTELAALSKPWFSH